MSEAPEPAKQRKPIALVPVGLKEAALDSPTFRSGYTHFTEQIDLVERWLETWLKSVSKIITETAPLEGMIYGLLTQTVPPTNVSEAVLDHDYTLLAIKRYGDAARDIWTSTILGMRRMGGNMVEPVRILMQNDLRNFKECRRVLEQTQKVYDGLLYRYYAQNKVKEPSSLREDAFQLHEARKAYLKASMDFSVMAPQRRTALDNVLVKVFSDQWRDMRNSRDSLNSSVRRWNKDIERVRSWGREVEIGEAAFRKELLNARKQIEDNTEARSRPSRELEDYSASATQSGGSKCLARTEGQSDDDEPQKGADKQGWLFLRTLTGKPTRTVWVRRWGFVKNGIFGWLVQGSRSGGVEESDRIGVLLCNIRPAQSEERRFSFEVKTKDSVHVLQAESQADLVAWMETFGKAKQIALENSLSVDSPAFAITSPPAPEFAADSGMYQLREDGLTSSLERGSTLPVPGTDSGFGLPSRSSTDVSGHRRSTGGDREGESGRDHASRIIQKLDIHRKSTGGPPVPNSPLPSTPALTGGGIASLIAASHNVMPVGPPIPPQSAPTDAQSNRPGSSKGFYGLPVTNLAPDTLANAPLPTNLSTTAVVVSGERAMSTDTIGVTSNIWGSSYVGYLNRLGEGVARVPSDVSGGKISSSQAQSSGSQSNILDPGTDAPAEGKSTSPSKTPSPSPKKTMSLPGGPSNPSSSNILPTQYPDNYPTQLRTQDAQFRLLFPSVSRDETVLLVFRATWSLNEQQEFPGRVYVTAHHMYFYSHHLGLILTSGINLETVSEVTAAPGRDYDLLFVHLTESSNDMPSTRITVKAFLEPLKSLQRRLDFLVRNCSADEPTGTETLIETLIKLDPNESANNAYKDQWEDFTATATSDDGRGARSALHAAVMLDRGREGSSYRADGVAGASRIKLPRQPVVFVPTGMDRVVVDKVFDISSKALFHVMFGDRSALWQLLYHERRAQRIKQSAWVRSGNDLLRRDFEYQIDYIDVFGRVHTTAVTDYQMIDSLNEHLCYVVTDRKTPWALPYGQNFSLLTKIVITHHAKSKCRLAIYTRVDWESSVRLFQGLVTTQALEDLHLDALDLVDLITDQVRKLGAQSRTKKAVQIFGQVGAQNTGSEFAGSDTSIDTRARRLIKHRSLARLMAGSLLAVGNNSAASATRCTLALLGWIWRTLNANAVIMLILAVSTVANVFFTSTGTAQWWKDRQVVNYLGRLGVGSNNLMTKAVYLQDVHDAWAPTWESGKSGNACRATFDAFLSSTDMNAVTIAEQGPVAGRKGSFDRLGRWRRRLGSHRHDLLVALRVINSIERGMVDAEWEGWLEEENMKCKHMKTLMRQNRTAPSDSGDQGSQQPSGVGSPDRTQIMLWHGVYCGSCAQEKELLVAKQVESVKG
ncbi:SNF1-interacting protein [Xanthoria calcicola]